MDIEKAMASIREADEGQLRRIALEANAELDRRRAAPPATAVLKEYAQLLAEGDVGSINGKDPMGVTFRAVRYPSGYRFTADRGMALYADGYRAPLDFSASREVDKYLAEMTELSLRKHGVIGDNSVLTVSLASGHVEF